MKSITAALCWAFLIGTAALADEPAAPVPLTDLGTGKYEGFQGGLYAAGRNEPWGAHAEALRRRSAAIVPRDKAGRPDPHGKIVVVGIGASVCRQVFAELEKLAPDGAGKEGAVVFVNCAKGGHDVNKLADPALGYWQDAKASVEKRGYSLAQVQAAWYQSDELKDARADFPGRPQRLQESIAGNMRLLKENFPAVQICYHSARHNTTFTGDRPAAAKHGEPRPYHVGWAVKWLIEEQAAGKAELECEGEKPVVPLIAWSTYFWTLGDKPRGDGYRWSQEEVVADGVHLSEIGRTRVAKELLAFFAADPFAKTWFGGKAAEAAVAAKPAAPPPGDKVTRSADGTGPAWIVNGKDKIPKLGRLLATTDNVRVVVRDKQGKQLAEIKDVFQKRSDLNALLGAGQYRIEFFDKAGQRIKLTQEVGEILNLK